MLYVLADWILYIFQNSEVVTKYLSNCLHIIKGPEKWASPLNPSLHKDEDSQSDKNEVQFNSASVWYLTYIDPILSNSTDFQHFQHLSENSTMN